jgi:hypothetical protein
VRDHEIEVRSFHAVFDLERRIHKIDSWRIPLPYGLPLRSIGYALAALMVLLVAQRLPVVGLLVTELPTPLRYVVIPCAVAWTLTQVTVDGRPAHLALAGAASFLSGPRCVAACAPVKHGRVAIDDVVVFPDERSARVRRCVIQGPASVLMRHPFGSRQRGRTLYIEAADDRVRMAGTRVRLQPGQRLVIR